MYSGYIFCFLSDIKLTFINNVANAHLPQLRNFHKKLQSLVKNHFILLCNAHVCASTLYLHCVSDILGDGTIHPWQLIRAPVWLKGYSGNELQRTARQLAMQGRFIREMLPTKYHKLTKNLNFQFKKLNRRQKCRWFGGYTRFSRIDKPRLRYWYVFPCNRHCVKSV